jgi:acetyl-CoA carboxylase biotin carboxyl carrier protein
MESEKIVKKFIKLAKDEGLSELKFEDKSFKIEMKFPYTSVTQVDAPMAMQPVAMKAAPVQEAPVAATPAATEKAQPKPSSSENLHEITAPLVGTFYASSSPGKDAFVTVGSKVSVGQTLCIVEAMKIMNEIECDVNGEIVEICVGNENVVEYGQLLFKVRLS